MTETRLEKANYTFNELNYIKKCIANLNNLTDSGGYSVGFKTKAASLFPTISEENCKTILKIVFKDLEEQLAKTTALFQQL